MKNKKRTSTKKQKNSNVKIVKISNKKDEWNQIYPCLYQNNKDYNIFKTGKKIYILDAITWKTKGKEWTGKIDDYISVQTINALPFVVKKYIVKTTKYGKILDKKTLFKAIKYYKKCQR